MLETTVQMIKFALDIAIVGGISVAVMMAIQVVMMMRMVIHTIKDGD